jgi:hypothetical protein
MSSLSLSHPSTADTHEHLLGAPSRLVRLKQIPSLECRLVARIAEDCVKQISGPIVGPGSRCSIRG